MNDADPGSLQQTTGRIIGEIERVVVGKRHVLRMLLGAVLADGHVLLEDVPGVAKTLTARSLAQVVDLSFARIQFTPDLAPADVTGSSIFDQRRQEFEFRPGPVFANLILADEINRAPAKTQASLLEGMEERRVTADGVTHGLPEPFLVIATQNPIDFEGTYPLPEAQLDRFLARLTIGYPDPHQEVELLRRRLDRGRDDASLRQVVGREELLGLQQAVEQVHVDDSLLEYIAAIVNATRDAAETELGASPRGSLAVLKLARSWAALDGRGFVLPDDVKVVAPAALGHRLILRPEHWVRGLTGADVARRCIDGVPAPPPVDYGATS